MRARLVVRPLGQWPTCPTKIWRPPSPCPTCPTKIWRPPGPFPTCPAYSNFSQLHLFGCTTCPFPTLFFQIFLGFLLSFHFFEKHFWTKSLFQSTVMLEREQITNKFPRKDRRQPWPYPRTHGYVCLEFNSSVLWLQHIKKLIWKVLYSVCKSHALSYPSSWESSKTLRGYKSGTPNPWGSSTSLTSLADIDFGNISSEWTRWRKFTRKHIWAWKYLASILPLLDGNTKLAALKSLSICADDMRCAITTKKITS